MITELKDNEIFVFGSNLLGSHGGGAAHQAYEFFEAQEGVGEGPTGKCYAFPTLTKDFEPRDHHDLKNSVRKFFTYAIQHPGLTFLMTPVGTGIAGYSPSYMENLFLDPPPNVVLPQWK